MNTTPQQVSWILGAIVFLLLAATGIALADENAPKTGSIQGQVIDIDTRSPIPGASVRLIGTQKGAAANDQGRFTISTVPVGNYAVQITSVGYDAQTRTDVIVRPGRITFVEMHLRLAPTDVGGMVVSSGFFEESATQPTSTTSLTGEEVRRSPGSAGDVSRIIFALPSVAKVNDQVNNLIVRGGNPNENAFYLDNIEIPNINHYPLFGTSGGPISLINTDFIRDVTFSAGGFSAAYGDRLSSVMELSFREGNREEFDGQLDMTFAGLGGIGEGPINGGKGSWLFSARRSYLDLLVDAIGTGVVPKYSDYQGKVVYDFSPQHRITTLGVLGIDYIDFDKETSIDEGNIVYGKSDGYEYAIGMNWRYLWGKNGYSNTSLSLLNTNVKGDYFETKSDLELIEQDNSERTAQLRNINFYRLNESQEFEFGFETKYVFHEYDYFAAEYTTPLGDTTPPLIMNTDIRSPKVGLFANYIYRPFNRLQATLGLRYDYFEYTTQSHVSPRFSLAYQLGPNTTLTGATGMYYQTLPYFLLAQQESNRDLKDPVSYHYVLGLEQMLTDDTKLTVEGYYKNYDNFPMNPIQPELFIADEVVYDFFISNHEELVSEGEARSYGVEVTVQKKLVEGIYGLVSGALFKSEYRDLNGVWRDRVYDNRFVGSVEGGYKPNEKWEYSLRWIFAGGAPRTPLDLEASQEINRSVYDRTRVNDVRYPDYHSLNLRVDRRFHFTNSNLIVFFSVWNAYNRENVAQYYWNELEGKQDAEYQWSLLPIIGLEFEF